MNPCKRCNTQCSGLLCHACQKAWNFCECGNVKQRKVAQCKACRPKFIRNTCQNCGKRLDRKKSKICRECYGYHVWTSAEDEFIRLYYPQHGANWCGLRLAHSVNKIRVRASELGVALSPKAYKRIVHDAATKANTGIVRSPEYGEACRQRNLQRLDFFNAQLLKGRLKYRKSKPTSLEILLSDILSLLKVAFETQVAVGDRYVVDALIGNIVIEADGDWWHGHPRFAPLTEKQIRRQQSDKEKDKYLAGNGYRVIRIWECDMSIDTVGKALSDTGIIDSASPLAHLWQQSNLFDPQP